MTQLSLSAAARTAGISRSTLHDHIATGKVSVQIDGQGRRAVDTSELLRVYGALRGAPDSSVVQSGSQVRAGADITAGQELRERVAVLETENRGLQALLSEKDARIDELRNTVRLLEHRRVAVPTSMMARLNSGVTTVPAKPVASMPDRMLMITVVVVLLLTGLALTLQFLGIIHLGPG